MPGGEADILRGENMTFTDLRTSLRSLADPDRAEHSQRFFKTGKGEYGEGDRFLGIRVPLLRKEAKRHRDISLGETERLLKSPFHEERLCALFLLVDKFGRGSEDERKAIYSLYLRNTHVINNWDLVDSSAQYIVGGYLEDKDKQQLYVLADSENLWERRIAVLATFHFIKKDRFHETLALAELLMNDQEDLIHKAVGWMLREIGNRDAAAEKGFLKKQYKRMPRTMLRYAIEKFPEAERKSYLRGDV